MPHPIAMIPYINMAPYRAAGPPQGTVFIPMVPSRSVSAIRRSEVLAAALPVGALAGLADRVKPIGRHGIAAGERSMSVLFFSDLPMARMHRHDAIRVTPDSTSSVRLLDLLLAAGHRADTAPAALPKGELVIGDAALVRLFQWRAMAVDPVHPPGYRYVTDLATAWHARWRLPFVFARWVIRRDAPEDLFQSIEDWLHRFTAMESRWVQAAIPQAVRATGLPESWIETYFQVIRRSLSDEDLFGQELFLKLIGPQCSDADRVASPLAREAAGPWGTIDSTP